MIVRAALVPGRGGSVGVLGRDQPRGLDFQHGATPTAWSDLSYPSRRFGERPTYFARHSGSSGPDRSMMGDTAGVPHRYAGEPIGMPK